LELLLDNGIVGMIPVFLFYFIILKYSMGLFRDSGSAVCTAAGGVAFALVSALLFASVGSQTFYPREGSVGMWCSIGLMLRVYQQRRKAVADGALPEGIDDLLWANMPANSGNDNHRILAT
jgi:hypothetical protein